MLCHKCNADIPAGAILCAACGAVVNRRPGAVDAAAVDKRCRRINLRRLLTFGLAVVLLLSGIGGMLIYNSPDQIARRYIAALIQRDIPGMLSLSAGDMQAMLEHEMSDAERSEFFATVASYAEECDVDAEVTTFRQCYRTLRAVTKKVNDAAYTEVYGEGYRLTIEVKDSEDMGAKEFNTLCANYQVEPFADYIDTAQLKIGRYVTVKATVSGPKGSDTVERIVPLVRYKGAWRVVTDPRTIF